MYTLQIEDVENRVNETGGGGYLPQGKVHIGHVRVVGGKDG